MGFSNSPLNLILVLFEFSFQFGLTNKSPRSPTLILVTYLYERNAFYSRLKRRIIRFLNCQKTMEGYLRFIGYKVLEILGVMPRGIFFFFPWLNFQQLTLQPHIDLSLFCFCYFL